MSGTGLRAAARQRISQSQPLIFHCQAAETGHEPTLSIYSSDFIESFCDASIWF
jgi:hypothetical protein